VPRNFWLLLTPGQYAVNLPECASRFGNAAAAAATAVAAMDVAVAVASWKGSSLKWVTYFMLNILHFISLMRECETRGAWAKRQRQTAFMAAREKENC